MDPMTKPGAAIAEQRRESLPNITSTEDRLAPVAP